jgi:hypothetical protein
MSNQITPEELKRLFPRATASTIKANAEAARDLVQKRIAIPARGPEPVPIDQQSPNAIKMGISTDEAKLNKNERAYLAWLRTQKRYVDRHPEHHDQACLRYKIYGRFLGLGCIGHESH